MPKTSVRAPARAHVGTAAKPDPTRPYAPPPRFRWPGGADCAVMLGFDVDGETTALSEDRKLVDHLSTMSQCTYGPTVGVPRLLGLLGHVDVPATFYVPGWVAEHHPRMVQAIADGGHEIGVHGWLHERLPTLGKKREREILLKSADTLERLSRTRPVGYRAPWFEINPRTPGLLRRAGFLYDSSLMGDDVPYLLDGGLVEIPAQWMLEDWEQFAFNADPHWGVIPENCDKVYDLWWQEFAAMHDYGCCFVLTMHPWLMGRPSRVKLLERLIRDMRASGNVWFARGHEIARWVTDNPTARREVDFDCTDRRG
ncbi:polysaccharide deacetylase [Candidatus Binatia bacterium]|nr:polysaccharide deacetylase [Candidatus Binatia bacterium]